MIRKLRVNTSSIDRANWLKLLSDSDIKSEENVDEVFGIFEDDELVATASRYQNVIKCVAIKCTHQGGSTFNEMITHLINENVKHNYFKHYVYTKVESQKAFEYLGFKVIESVDDKLVFMEKAILGFDQFISNLEKSKVDGDNIAAIVMNANPFTLGHQYLITEAAQENDHLFVFVLSEEMSAFDSQTRFELVKKGVAHLDNVTILKTDSYMVSNATFPAYFLKEAADTTVTQARLDAKIFANHIAPALNINKRYVGEEPYSIATNIYNKALRAEFCDKLQLIIIPRIKSDENVISATKVRNFLVNNQLAQVKKFVPKTTYDFLISDAGQDIINQLKERDDVHP